MKRGIITLTAVVFMVSAPAFSQNPWSDHENRNSVSFERVSPRFDPEFTGQIDMGIMTYVGYLNARIRLNDHVFLLAEVPFSHYQWRLDDATTPLFNRNTERGNPYIGTELRLHQNPDEWAPFFSLGTYLPGKQKTIYPDEAMACGCLITQYGEQATPALSHNIRRGAHPALLSDFDRGEAFWPDVWSVRANAGTTRLFFNDRARIWLSTGIIHNIYRGDWAELMNRETHLTYSAHLSSFFDGFTINTSLFGRSPLGVKVTEEIITTSGNDNRLMRTLDFADDSLIQFRMGLERDFGPLSLGAFFIEPLAGGQINTLKRSFGFTVGVHI